MLVLSRRPDEAICIGGNIEVVVIEVRGNSARIGVRAPREIEVDRKEIHLRKLDAQAERSAVAAASLRGRDSIPGKARNAFRVWLRPLGAEYRVCVDGIENAKWLLGQLRGLLVQTSQPISEENSSSLCSFLVPYNARLPYLKFEHLLTAIPEVTLMLNRPKEDTRR
jgi:carbon storage regulator